MNRTEMPRGLLTVLTAFVLVGCAGCGKAPSVADDFEARRAALLARPRPMIWNTDGNDMELYPKGLPIDAASFESVRLKWTEGTRVSTVFYCPQSSGFGYFTTTKAGDFKTVQVQPDNPKAYNAAADFAAAGLDALEMASAYCRRRGLEIFVSIRFNDTHDNAGMQKPGAVSPHFSPFKAAHPDCLMGTVTNRPRYCAWTAVDFAHAEVRDYAKSFMRQFFENYDIDGVEYDFFRHPQLFKTVANGADATPEELRQMTDLMRELRRIADEVGRKRGKPFLVAVRVPDSVGYCRTIGIDLEKWMDEKLVDMVIGSGYFQLNPWKTTADLVHKHGCRFYASLDEARNQPKRAPLGLLPGRSVNRSFYLPRLREALQGGADGVYLFNLEQKKLKAVATIDPSAPADCARLYFALPRATAHSQLYHYCAKPDRFYNMPLIEPQRPLKLTKGAKYEMTMTIGTEPFDASGFACTAQLLSDKSAAVRLAVNGTPCTSLGAEKGVTGYSVPREALHAGDNVISFAAEDDCRLADFCLKMIQ